MRYGDSDITDTVSGTYDYQKKHLFIICNYKVLISVVTSEQVNKEMLKRGEVLINGDVVNAQHIASQIAFKEAINKYNIRRVFTFHKSVKAAKAFTGKGSEGVSTQISEFNTFHVNGTMPTAMREGIMNEFNISDYSIISNARCLTEGVDLPAVDMVAFMSPKKSKVDIVQATGRAIRKDHKNPDKTFGYIFVPLYLEITTGESIDDAVAKADFGEVWNVLQALQEHDAVLADIIRQMLGYKGRYGKYKDGGLGDKVDILGVDISLKTLQESITAVCIDKLGFTWDMRFGELIKYKERFGDCNVPQDWSENKQLGSWVNNQRTYYRKGILYKDRIKRLEDKGFVWEPIEAQWEEMFAALQEYKEKYGDCFVPSRWSKDRKLGSWVNTQRQYYRKGITLSNDQIKRLEDKGFAWEPFEAQWEEMFAALKEYKEKYGDCFVPRHYRENTQLGTWVHSQRRNYQKKTLSKDQIKRLEAKGFVWEPFEALWEEMFTMLKEYKDKHGNCNVPAKWKENKQLGVWVSSQRANYKKEIVLSKDQIKRLEDEGFAWERKGVFWEEMFTMLKEYKDKQGNCNVPQRWKANEQLGKWVSQQRVRYKKGVLIVDQIKRLEDIGFEWERKGAYWEEMFTMLKEYKDKQGNCNVPQRWKANEQLGSWVNAQRQYYRKGISILSKDQIKRLEDIGFVWDTLKTRWEELFEVLKKYKKDHGDCNVPTNWTENMQLSNWVAVQRRNYKNKILTDDNINCLENIGFEWGVLESQWEEMFEELKKYKENHGNCNVPKYWSKNKRLGNWVSVQRSKYKNGKLGDDNINRLENIGFEWKVRK